MPLPSSKEKYFQKSGIKVTFKLNEIEKSIQFFCTCIFRTVFASYLKYGVLCLFGTIAYAMLCHYLQAMLAKFHMKIATCFCRFHFLDVETLVYFSLTSIW